MKYRRGSYFCTKLAKCSLCECCWNDSDILQESMEDGGKINLLGDEGQKRNNKND